MPDFFAHSHSRLPESDWHKLAAHLNGVSKKAESFARKLGLLGWGATLGVLHDIGKYSSEFQGRVRGAPEPVDHSTAGVQLAASTFGLPGRLIAYGVAGHHGGLPNGVADPRRPQPPTRTALVERLERKVPAHDAYLQEVAVPPGLTKPQPKFHPTAGRDRIGFSLAHAARMAFSALVDADYLDTEAYYAGADGWQTHRGNWPKLEELVRQLDAHLGQFLPSNDLAVIRAEILAAARLAAPHAPGIFSLSVPTGGGKTLSSLAWALNHALTHGLDKIIYAIPFTSIVEQTADVFRQALGPHASCIVEHHTAYREQGDDEGKAKLRRATENWDARIIVTTNVQLFESLFAAKPGRCRKLHNIANAVVILDEAQTLPVDYLMPCIAMLDEMARNYRTSILLCTATQPAITEQPDQPSRSLVGGLIDVTEIAPPNLHDRLRRVIVREGGSMADGDLVAAIAERTQGLVIVNTREHARNLYRSMGELDGATHLDLDVSGSPFIITTRHQAEVAR